MTQPSQTDSDVECRICELETSDGRRLFARRWGDVDSETVFVIVHGLGEHGGCYADFATHLADMGMATLAYDHHGHGYSPGRRGDAPSLQTLVDDISIALTAAAENWPSARPVLLGHSMGGNLVLKYLLGERSPKPFRTIVTNPIIMPPSSPTKSQIWAAWLTGKMISRLRVQSTPDPTQLTQDPEVIAEMAHDPLLHYQMSIGLGSELVVQGDWLLEHAGELQERLLILIGDEDELTDLDATHRFAKAAGTDCKLHSFAGLRHNLLHEADRDTVFDAMTEWLRRESEPNVGYHL